jgi:hypothetical protein
MTNVETVAVDTNTGTNVNRDGMPNLTVQNVEIRKKSKIVGAGTDSPIPLRQEFVLPYETGAEKTLLLINMQKRECISLQPYSVANSNKATINDIDIPNKTISSNAIGISNTVHLNDANEIKVHDQTVPNLQVSNSLREDTNNAVQNVNNDICNRNEIIGNVERSEQQPDSGTLFTEDSVIVNLADQGCSKDMCDGRELNIEIKTKDGVVGEVDADIQVKNNTICGIHTTANKEGIENNYASKELEKVDKDNELEKPKEPCCDILRDDSVVNEGRRKDSDVERETIVDVESHEVPIMVDQASQTDLEECVEDSDGLRFLSVPQKAVVTMPAIISKPAQIINAVSKTAAVGKSPIAPLCTGVRMSLAPIVKLQPSARPAYAAVSNLSSPASTRNYSLSHTSLMTSKPNSSPRFVQNRISSDVRPAGRGTALRKLSADPAAGLLKSQRPTSATRQVRNWICL